MPRLSESERLRIVHLSSEGISTQSVAAKVGCSVKTVRFWIKRHRFTGSAKSSPAPGRPLILSTIARRHAVQLLVKGIDGGARFVSRELHAKGFTDGLVSPGTVLRAAKAQAKEDGDKLICRRGRPPKLLSAANRTKRISFAKKNGPMNWRHVMFTDRCKFAFRYPGAVVRSVRWMKNSQKHQDGAPRPSKPSVYNVYGGITRWGTTKLHVVTGTTGHKSDFKNKRGAAARNITQGEYAQVLKQTLLREGQRIFSGQGMSTWTLQQDGDKSHARAQDVVDVYNRKCRGSTVSVLRDWPSNSPDLSPIENVWGYVDREVAKMGCKTFADFKAAINVTFQNIPETMRRNLFDSVPKRMRDCIMLDGYKTAY